MPSLKLDCADPYLRRFTFPKWNGTVNVTQEYRLFRYLPEFADWTKAQHECTSRALLTAASITEGIYRRKVRAALRRYGDHGSLVCAVVRDYFPEHVKKQLRIAYVITEQRDRAYAHWRASGRTITTYRRLFQEVG